MSVLFLFYFRGVRIRIVLNFWGVRGVGLVVGFRFGGVGGLMEGGRGKGEVYF